MNEDLENRKHTMEEDRQKRQDTSSEKKDDGSALRLRPGVPTPGSTSPHFSQRSGAKSELSIDAHVEGILAGDRVILGQTITLIESLKPEHNMKAMTVMERVIPHAGNSIRVGITGVPGVGKSTFIEALGDHLTGNGHKLAVLAIDPSSQRSGGSIMGDKTRMETLSTDPNAFIRPSPSAGSLGGVARKTREVMLLCEAAGFDTIFIETVGVGQSETMVHSMVDFFLLLMLPGAGDELQGIKRGIMELADALVINKADGSYISAARHAKSEFEAAVHLMKYPFEKWLPPVLTCSSLSGEGVKEVWLTIERYKEVAKAEKYFEKKRAQQSRAWMFDSIRQSLEARFLADPQITKLLPELEAQVEAGSISSLLAAQRLLKEFFREDISLL